MWEDQRAALDDNYTYHWVMTYHFSEWVVKMECGNKP